MRDANPELRRELLVKQMVELQRRGRVHAGHTPEPELRQLRQSNAHVQHELSVARVVELQRRGRVQPGREPEPSLRQLRQPNAHLRWNVPLEWLRRLHRRGRLRAGQQDLHRLLQLVPADDLQLELHLAHRPRRLHGVRVYRSDTVRFGLRFWLPPDQIRQQFQLHRIGEQSITMRTGLRFVIFEMRTWMPIGISSNQIRQQFLVRRIHRKQPVQM